MASFARVGLPPFRSHQCGRNEDAVGQHSRRDGNEHGSDAKVGSVSQPDRNGEGDAASQNASEERPHHAPGALAREKDRQPKSEECLERADDPEV